MSASLIIFLIVAYFALLVLISLLTSRNNGSTNDAFFLGNRQSPWWVVAIGMVGASLSGVSFISVPGMVRGIDFTYMQTVIGFFFGYLVIANVLLPIYYKKDLTTIYGYLHERFGKKTYKTGAWFFLLSKIIGAAVRLYIVVLILQNLVFSAYGVPFWLTASLIVVMIWVYTSRSGIKTIVWTDTLQTIILVACLVLIIVQTFRVIDQPFAETISGIINSNHTRIFVFDDWQSKQNFFKQFFSGIFIAIVMTGLDQDMMQKNLTCRSLSDAKKNMYWYGISFVPVNFLFLSLGTLLLYMAAQQGIALPTASDEILPLFATEHLGQLVSVLFVVGIVAAAFSSADSALTALTTSFVVDILEVDQKQDEVQSKRTRKIAHVAISTMFIFIIIAFRLLNNTNVIDAVYVIASYTYGPLLGMYALGLFTKHATYDRLVPYIAVLSPVLCALLDHVSSTYWSYNLGYELLMINGFITFTLLWVVGKIKQF